MKRDDGIKLLWISLDEGIFDGHIERCLVLITMVGLDSSSETNAIHAFANS